MLIERMSTLARYKRVRKEKSMDCLIPQSRLIRRWSKMLQAMFFS
ncbi:uncharacterized protein CELE_ZC404.16 [Caenorhabditis elegans]|uniref:Uncharacterized protein n=1 Tax=Caenorhabditis elegans TaxID=6239 RepID=E0AHA5_CAEEL|nr:Uncharacterized protein CELE_ZC404.16 [Caenorhabditis elegans]CCD72502.1 Uncharacterized protein CELE_ZC404.16 [Caenorhabditis elegans]|eukprot:NP_001256069.1 Uncharacterized protein CELE_ZC404.16 [Caenorhabditis elegans]